MSVPRIRSWKWFPTVLLFLGVASFGNGYRVGDNRFHRKDVIDPKGKYELEWEVDWEAERVIFTVTVETRGYVGFGLSSNGKMSGADVVIGGVKPNGVTYFSDRHAIANQMPELDPSQDWRLLTAWENSSHTCLTFSRAFDTCDPLDYAITTDKISVIWAYGEKDDNVVYHFENRGVYNAYLLDPEYAPQIIREGRDTPPIFSGKNSDVQTWTVRRTLQIPEAETSYICTMHRVPPLEKKHHFVGIYVNFHSEESRAASHHIIMYKCTPPPGVSARTLFEPFVGNTQGQSCLTVAVAEGPMPLQFCAELYSGWAVGGRPFFLPDNMGFSFGASQDEYYAAQVHYNNPSRRSNLVVDLSIETYYSPTLRPHEGGIVSVGVDNPGLPTSILLPPNSRAHRIFGHCSSDCTELMLPEEGITVETVLLHTHNTGRRLRLRHFRKGRELPWIVWDENYGFNFQQLRPLRRGVRVLPGDQLTMECIYDSTAANGTVVGGFATRQEMCMAFPVYHTRIEDYGFCRSNIDSEEQKRRFLGIGNVTWSNERLEYIVDTPPDLAGLTVSEVSDNFVNWNLQRRKDLRDLHLYHEHVGACTRLGHRWIGDEFDNFMSPVGYPWKAKEYRRPVSKCSKRTSYF